MTVPVRPERPPRVETRVRSSVRVPSRRLTSFACALFVFSAVVANNVAIADAPAEAAPTIDADLAAASPNVDGFAPAARWSAPPARESRSVPEAGDEDLRTLILRVTPTPLPTPVPIAEETALADPTAAAEGPTVSSTASPPPATPTSAATPPLSTAATSPTPAPPATASAGGSSRCPIPMPAPPTDGWSRVVTSTFSETTPLGAWPGPVAAKDWRNRPAGAKDSSGRGTYDSSKTVSEHSGMLDVWIHSAVDGAPHVHNPAGQRYTAAPIPVMGHTHGARITTCMRTDVVPGYKIAFLLWPDEGPGNHHGEIDFPEARLLGGGITANAFMHYAPKPSSGKNQDAYDSGASLQEWHAYTIEWNPKAPTPYVKFYVDGQLFGHSTEHIPTRPMQYVMQIETFLAGQELPPPAEGHVQIDWVTIDLP